MIGRPATAPRRGLPLPWLWVAAGAVALAGAAVGVPALAPLALAGAALVVAAPAFVALARRAAWTIPVLVAVAVLLADLGGRSIAPGPYRYVPTAAVVVAILLVGVRADRTSRALRTTALLLFGYGILGTLYGRFALGTINGTLPLVGPMLIACLPPVRNWTGDAGWRTGLRVLSVAGSLFAVFSGLTRLGLLPSTQIDVVNHEKAFVFVLAIGAALAARDRLLLVVALATTVFAFTTYPAATYALAAVVGIGTVVLAKVLPDTTHRVIFAVIGATSVMAAVLYVDRLIDLTNGYFELVGKQNNGDTRAALYAAALDRLQHPVFGSFFAGDITVVGDLSGQDTVVPVHNDYLSVTLGGGVLAAALLLAIFFFANGLVVRMIRAGVPDDQRRAAVALLAAVNAAAVTAFANPVFMNPGASALTFSVLAALVAVCRRPPDAAPPVTDPARTVTKTRTQVT